MRFLFTTVKLAGAVLACGLCVAGQRSVEAQSLDNALVLHGCPSTITFDGKSEGYVYEVCADIVFTPSGNINGSLHGALLDLSTAPGKAVVVNNFPCQYNGLITYDSKIVITPDGSVNGYCKLKKSSQMTQ